MNKKETAAFEALQNELRLAKSLRFTEPVRPDVPPPTSEERGNRLTVGYDFAGALGTAGGRVEVACSSSVHHALGRTDKTTSQGSRALYSTRLLALRALRHEVEQECAKRLAGIDKQIEQELALDASPNGTE